ncbi:Magnesium-transporting ATPase, P-type 1 [Listeria cornellensis FSL F6-0969]|uniref:Magnesium-transporting ATPase, P-type 1 n=1 Tax=Listeria cornellensis FSL F6-0969 TaxID=1265820 RepID=W7C661_9LIST|nr:Magnesium-transporting ATPase, P-type 1 [Listeria cornellensis FSL F6-0969]
MNRTLLQDSTSNKDAAIAKYKTTTKGLNEVEVTRRRTKFGPNITAEQKPTPWYVNLAKAFHNPFIYILAFLMIISYVTADIEATIIMALMILFSVILSFTQSMRAQKASLSLKNMIENTTAIIRDGMQREIPIVDVVPGDIVFLSTGDIIPADVRIIEAKDLFINQSPLTGESIPVEKFVEAIEKSLSIFERDNLAFMGTDVISGQGKALILKTGDNTIFGSLSQEALAKRDETSFDKGVKSISKLLMYLMLVMVPIVFLINGIMKGNWTEALLFAVAVAVGLTPEMLPMIVNTNLAKGAVRMARKKVIIKELSAIQNLGAMDVLCTDKTGTLTKDKVELIEHIDTTGETSDEVLALAFQNSHFQTGWKNIMDHAIISHMEKIGDSKRFTTPEKIDEIPFDFARRRLSVILRKKDSLQMITKGAITEMFDVCSKLEENGAIIELTDPIKKRLHTQCEEMNRNGMRVIAIATKTKTEKETFSVIDEQNMTLIGFLGFLDPAKPSAKPAIASLHDHGVTVKVLTGDNEIVAQTICNQVGIPSEKFLLGSDIDFLYDDELTEVTRTHHIFAKLTPTQKSRIIHLIRKDGHTVGFMGDGINDAPALRKADVGISVDTAADITKDASSVILLEKSLTILNDAVTEGRNVFGNILKYMKMTASSNFGNVFSVLVASAFLPFLPMLSIHLLLQNLMYDVSQMTLPWDKMDESFLKKPRKWDRKNMLRFILLIGPVSSIFDILTFAIMWFVFSANTIAEQALFQSGWFVVGLLTQTLVVHMIRTEKIPFIQSRAAKPVMISTLIVMGVGIIIPFTSFGHRIGLVSLPLTYFPWLIAILAGYMVTVQIAKNLYIKKFHDWI